MRILFLNQFFWPDTAATGQLMSDVAEYLVGSGDTVEVICGSATYGGSNSTPCPMVSVTRLCTSAFSGGLAGRLASYLSFFAGALWYGLIRNPVPDIVVTLTTPPLISLVGMAIQKLRGAKHIVWEMDVYPDIAVDLGVLKPNSFSTRVLTRLADWPRHRADRVIALGECMRVRLLAHGLAEERLYVAENWADCDALPSRKINVRPLYSDGLSIIYSGNLGRAHDVETIAGAMNELNRADDVFQFVFGGGGSRRAWIRDFCEKNGVKNVHFLDYCEREELGARLVAANIGLVTQHRASSGAIVPSKTYGILAAGRPVLFIGPRQSTTADIIKQFGCGWQIDCGDWRRLVELLRHLSAHKELVREAGQRAYQAFVNHYQRSLGVIRVAAVLHGEEDEVGIIHPPSAYWKAAVPEMDPESYSER